MGIYTFNSHPDNSSSPKTAPKNQQTCTSTRERATTRNTRQSMDEKSDHREEWVGDAVLNALGVDRWDKHVDEMMNYDSHSIPAPMAASTMSTSDQIRIKNLIKREVAARVDQKISLIVDAAITARLDLLNHPSATNTKANTVTNNLNGKMIRDLDQLQRHQRDQRTLNLELVDRLLRIPAGDLGQPGSRFANSTSLLKGTDRVNSLLVSYVEMLMVKVDMLQKKTDALKHVLTAYETDRLRHGGHMRN